MRLPDHTGALAGGRTLLLHKSNQKTSIAGRTGGASPAARFAVRLVLAAFVVSIAFAMTQDVAHAEPTFPVLSGRVVDGAGLLNEDDRLLIEGQLSTLEQQSSDQLVVVTVPSLQGYTIEDFGYRLGRHWAIGQKETDNGALLIVAPNERKVRIEVGRGLEPQLTDIMSRLIIENAILPAFRRGDFPAGIKAGVRDISDVMLGDPDAVKDRLKRRPGPEVDYEAILVLVLTIAIIIYILYHNHKQGGGPGPRRRGSLRRQDRYRDDEGIFIPGGSGGWGVSWPSRGRGGGGFSGGGGGFGGGGASGGW